MSSAQIPVELRVRHKPPEGYLRRWITTAVGLSVFCTLVVAGLYSVLKLHWWSLLGLLPMLLVLLGSIEFLQKLTRATMYRASTTELVMSWRWRRSWPEIEWMSIGGKYGTEYRVGLRNGKSKGFSLVDGYDVQWWEFFDYIGKVAPHVRFIDRRDHDWAWRQRNAGPNAPARPTSVPQRISQILFAIGGLAVLFAGLLFAIWSFAEPGRAMCDDEVMSPGDTCVSLNSGTTTTYQDELATAQRQVDGAPAALAVAVGGAVLAIGSAVFLFIADRNQEDDEDPDLPAIKAYQAVDRG
ncbi:hypothetical protein [Nocardia otitidiscaviarum]|uniref:hypothetical protein n=1 Tax=Nocardia otitidiscaviarum TaxID=1823 RepID=UPI0018951A51|nr:hypothetical protein [Nocardia otitidiscaviarum]MBF6180388.1 hypothetical protein [Nocardia otitidiscaviarum]